MGVDVELVTIGDTRRDRDIVRIIDRLYRRNGLRSKGQGVQINVVRSGGAVNATGRVMRHAGCCEGS